MGPNALDKAIGKRGYASRVVRGARENPSAPTIEAMAFALRIEPSWLAWGKGPAPQADQPVTAAA